MQCAVWSMLHAACSMGCKCQHWAGYKINKTVSHFCAVLSRVFKNSFKCCVIFCQPVYLFSLCWSKGEWEKKKRQNSRNMHLKYQFLGVQKRIRLSVEYPCATCSYLHCIYAQFYCCLLKLVGGGGGAGCCQQRLLEFRCLNRSANKTKHTLTFCQLVHFQHHKPGFVSRKIIVRLLGYPKMVIIERKRRNFHSLHSFCGLIGIFVLFINQKYTHTFEFQIYKCVKRYLQFIINKYFSLFWMVSFRRPAYKLAWLFLWLS